MMTSQKILTTVKTQDLETKLLLCIMHTVSTAFSFFFGTEERIDYEVKKKEYKMRNLSIDFLFNVEDFFFVVFV